jgi:SAM-dependent methyltransferase
LTAAIEPAYGPDHASIYDDLYAGRGKDYAAESALVIAEILARKPDATQLLDVGCGTGRHLHYLRRRFGDVSGVEPSPAMRELAEARLNGVPILDGSLDTLATGRTYDSVVCLFSVIGYAVSLVNAVARLTAHLNPGGVLIVEPWLSPDTYDVGHVGGDFTRTAERSIFRMSHSGLDGNVSVLRMDYLVGTVDGVSHFTDEHRLRLSTRREYQAAFKAAGCTVEYLTPGFGRGLFIGVRRPNLRNALPADVG